MCSLCVCVYLYFCVRVVCVYIHIYICMCVYVSVCLCVCVYFERIIWTRRRYASEKKRQMPGEMESEGLFFLRGESIIIQNILMYDFTTYIYVHIFVDNTHREQRNPICPSSNFFIYYSQKQRKFVNKTWEVSKRALVRHTHAHRGLLRALSLSFSSLPIATAQGRVSLPQRGRGKSTILWQLYQNVMESFGGNLNKDFKKCSFEYQRKNDDKSSGRKWWWGGWL